MKQARMSAVLGVLLLALFWGAGLASPPVAAQSGADQTMDLNTLVRANQLYESGSFAEAAQLYQQLIDKGIADSTVYYNAGNAYFRQGDLGRAVLNYERAVRLNPRDQEIRTSLSVAQQRVAENIVDVAPAAEEGALATADADSANSVESVESVNPVELLGETRPWLRPAAWLPTAWLPNFWLTRNEAAILALGCWLLFGGLFVLYRHTQARGLRRGLRYALVLTALLLLGGMGVLGSQLYVDYVRPQAVVLADSVEVRSGSGDQFAAIQTLPGGAKVSVLARENNWVKVTWAGRPGEGWAPATVVEAVHRSGADG